MSRSEGGVPHSQSKLAVVTGGASGLGREFCCELARRGEWYVVVADIDEAGGQATVEACTAYGPQSSSNAEFVSLDVVDEPGWRALRRQLQQRRPRLDLLINCAGVCGSAEVGEGSLDQFHRIFDVNFEGTLNGCHIMAPWMKREQTGHIVNVASIIGLTPGPAMSAYAASKAAVIALTEALYAELRPHGVGATVLAPGFFATSLLERGDFALEVHRQTAEDFTQSSKFTADDVVAATLREIDRGQLYVVLGRRARMLWRWKRLAPRSLARFLSRRYQAMLKNDAACQADQPSAD